MEGNNWFWCNVNVVCLQIPRVDLPQRLVGLVHQDSTVPDRPSLSPLVSVQKATSALRDRPPVHPNNTSVRPDTIVRRSVQSMCLQCHPPKTEPVTCLWLLMFSLQWHLKVYLFRFLFICPCIVFLSIRAVSERWHVSQASISPEKGRAAVRLALLAPTVQTKVLGTLPRHGEE